jgi:hypothetical protein
MCGHNEQCSGGRQAIGRTSVYCLPPYLLLRCVKCGEQPYCTLIKTTTFNMNSVLSPGPIIMHMLCPQNLMLVATASQLLASMQASMAHVSKLHTWCRAAHAVHAVMLYTISLPAAVTTVWHACSLESAQMATHLVEVERHVLTLTWQCWRPTAWR